jgi:hypothetical protein
VHRQEQRDERAKRRLDVSDEEIDPIERALAALRWSYAGKPAVVVAWRFPAPWAR